MSRTARVHAGKILSEMRELWASLGKENEGGVLRACSLNLLVAVDCSEDAVRVSDVLLETVHEHPSRIIVLRLECGSGDMLEFRVYARCWMPFGKRQQICCEQVEITVSPESIAHVAPVLRGILAPDLPVVLWAESASFVQMPEFDPVLKLAGKVIADTRDLTVGAAELIATLRSRVPNVGDLSWTAVTPWREAVVHTLEERGVKTVHAVSLSHGAEAMPAMYLRHWIESSVRVPVETRGGAEQPIGQIVLETDVGTLTLHANDKVRNEGEASLLHEELAITGHDPVFHRVLEAMAEVHRPAA